MDFRHLRRALASKLGAIEDREGGHIYYYLFIGGKEHRVGKVSHSIRGSEQVYDKVIGDTAQRLRLRRDEFLQFVDCSIDRNDHARLWQERQSQPSF